MRFTYWLAQHHNPISHTWRNMSTWVASDGALRYIFAVDTAQETIVKVLRVIVPMILAEWRRRIIGVCRICSGKGSVEARNIDIMADFTCPECDGTGEPPWLVQEARMSLGYYGQCGRPVAWSPTPLYSLVGDRSGNQAAVPGVRRPLHRTGRDHRLRLV